MLKRVLIVIFWSLGNMRRKGGKLKFFIVLIVIFLMGWFSSEVYSFFHNWNKEQPFSLSSNEVKSPGDWVKESQVRMRNQSVTIMVPNATWATFTDTNSMDPVIDSTSHAIKVMPKNESDIKIGDIVSYQPDDLEGIVIHRIVEKGIDEQGTFFITKGDNNKSPDPSKVRFSQITGVVVAIVY
jgi:hypothetical protein